MRLRTFTAPDMPSAMKQVREALGDGAVILSSGPIKGKSGVSVTAAMEAEEDAPAKPRVVARSAPGVETNYLIFELQNLLRFHNVPEFFIAKILQKLPETKATPSYALGKTLDAFFHFAPLPLEVPGLRLMLVGPHGAGKTLAIAKMAAQLSMQKQPVTVITTDNKRAGGIEQLQAFTDILDMPLKIAADARELKAHLTGLPKTMRVLIDTAGCNPYDPAELKELEDYAALEQIEPVLTLAAGGDSLECIDVAESFMALPIKRLLLTRADAAQRFGGVLAAAAAHNLAFCHAGASPRIVDTLQMLDHQRLAQLLLHYQRQDSSRLQSHAT